MNDWSDKTILIVEDDSINFNLLNIILKPTKVNVLWAKNGLEAVNLFSRSAQVNTILMDIQMPIMDGHEASLKIRELNNEVPIIIISAYTSKDVKQRAIEVGTNEFICKPVHSNHLLEIIEKYL